MIVMKKFHDLEFDIPENYHTINKDNYSSYVNNKVGFIDQWFYPEWFTNIELGRMIVMFDESNIEKVNTDSGSYNQSKEYMHFILGEKNYPSVSEKEYLIEYQKESYDSSKQENIELHREYLKLEISEIPSNSKYSIYSEIKWGIGQTSFMCDFFPFKENNRIYMTSLYCSDDLIDSSRENFNKILNSIKIK